MGPITELSLEDISLVGNLTNYIHMLNKNTLGVQKVQGQSEAAII